MRHFTEAGTNYRIQNTKQMRIPKAAIKIFPPHSQTRNQIKREGRTDHQVSAMSVMRSTSKWNCWDQLICPVRITEWMAVCCARRNGLASCSCIWTGTWSDFGIHISRLIPSLESCPLCANWVITQRTYYHIYSCNKSLEVRLLDMANGYTI